MDADTNLFAMESMVIVAKSIVGVLSTMVLLSITNDEQATTIEKRSKRSVTMIVERQIPEFSHVGDSSTFVFLRKSIPFHTLKILKHCR